MWLSRRRLIGAGGSVVFAGLAGCATVSGGGPQIDRTVRINEGSYARFSFEIDTTATFEYTVDVTEGSPIDVLLLPENQLLAFEFRDRWSPHVDGTVAGTRQADRSLTLPAGEWVLVLDNSDRWETTPPADYRNTQANVALQYAVTP